MAYSNKNFILCLVLLLYIEGCQFSLNGDKKEASTNNFIGKKIVDSIIDIDSIIKMDTIKDASKYAFYPYSNISVASSKDTILDKLYLCNFFSVLSKESETTRGMWLFYPPNFELEDACIYKKIEQEFKSTNKHIKDSIMSVWLSNQFNENTPSLLHLELKRNLNNLNLSCKKIHFEGMYVNKFDLSNKEYYQLSGMIYTIDEYKRSYIILPYHRDENRYIMAFILNQNNILDSTIADVSFSNSYFIKGFYSGGK